MDIEIAADIVRESHTHAWLRPNQAASPACSFARPPKQESAGMKSEASLD